MNGNEMLPVAFKRSDIQLKKESSSLILSNPAPCKLPEGDFVHWKICHVVQRVPYTEWMGRAVP